MMQTVYAFLILAPIALAAWWFFEGRK